MTVGGRLLVPIALVANAAVQALLVIGDPTPTLSPLFVLGALASGAAWLVAYAVVVARVVSPGSVAAVLRAHGAMFVVWIVALGVVVGLASIPLGGLLGYLVIAAVSYVPLAAMLGEPNPLAAGFRAIGRAPWGFIWRVVVFAILVVVAVVAVALTAFFVTGLLAAFVNSLVLGSAGWVITRSFGHEYRVDT